MIFFDIDTQWDFLDRDGALSVPDADAIKSQLEQLLLAAGEHRITTFSSRCAHDEADPEFKIFPPHCIDGTRGAERVFADLPSLPRQEIAVDALPDPKMRIVQGMHYVVKKKTFDLFSNLWLDELRRSGKFKDETCVIFGVATDYCVRACGLGLSGAAKQTLLVTDAIRGVAAATTSEAIEELRKAGVEFITTAEILTLLG